MSDSTNKLPCLAKVAPPASRRLLYLLNSSGGCILFVALALAYPLFPAVVPTVIMLLVAGVCFLLASHVSDGLKARGTLVIVLPKDLSPNRSFWWLPYYPSLDVYVPPPGVHSRDMQRIFTVDPVMDFQMCHVAHNRGQRPTQILYKIRVEFSDVHDREQVQAFVNWHGKLIELSGMIGEGAFRLELSAALAQWLPFSVSLVDEPHAAG